MRNFLSRFGKLTPDTVSHLTAKQRLGLELTSGLLILIGLAALLYFGASVHADAGIQEVLNWTAEGSDSERPSLILAFLDSFGIIIPVLVITLGLSSIWLGLWLRTADINAARWAQMSFLWLAIALGAVAGLHIVTNGVDWDAIQAALPLGAATSLLVAALVWLTRKADTNFVGQEMLSARQTRAAWNLLMPTLVVLVLVAARPLEQTFINSLTDKKFASATVPRFVGLDNYTKLLSFRVDEVNCRTNDEGECKRTPNGSISWELIERDLITNEGYRTAWNIQIPLIQSDDRSLAISGQDKDWLLSMWVTLRFVVASVSLEFIIGLTMALIVNSGFRGRGFMRAVMLVPWAIPTVISARLWELMLKDTTAGIINRVLMDVGYLDNPEAWLAQPHLQIPSAVAVDVWKTSPFMALLLLAGLQTIPTDLYEAAAVDGANRLRQFISITLPLLRPTIAVALVFRTLDALRVFDLFNVLYQRQQLTMATYNYEKLVNDQAAGYAAATGVLIFIFIFIFAVIYVRLLGVDIE